MTGLSWAGFYRSRLPRPVLPVEMEIRDAMQKIAVAFPAYGYCRMTAELRNRGFAINHKRVLRMMREDNLLCVRRRKFMVTTDSRHNLPVYPNLAQQLVLKAINQLWVADITYIRLQVEFVYLAVVLDAFSRRVIGWALSRTLEAELALSALRMALKERKPQPGMVHQSGHGEHFDEAFPLQSDLVEKPQRGHRHEPAVHGYLSVLGQIELVFSDVFAP
jgi:transposase InsO family protein